MRQMSALSSLSWDRRARRPSPDFSSVKQPRWYTTTIDPKRSSQRRASVHGALLKASWVASGVARVPRSDRLDLPDITDDVANALDDLDQTRAEGPDVPATLQRNRHTCFTSHSSSQ